MNMQVLWYHTYVPTRESMNANIRQRTPKEKMAILYRVSCSNQGLPMNEALYAAEGPTNRDQHPVDSFEGR